MSATAPATSGPFFSVPIFGAVHILWLLPITAAAVSFARFCRRDSRAFRPLRIALACALAGNELIWWFYRYSREGIHLTNLPLQLCDVTLWTTVLACLTASPAAVEFSYFAGGAGSAMALMMPDLWTPWPSYPAFYFFLVHGGVILACAVLVFGRTTSFSRRAVWRAFGLLAAYGLVVGAFNAAVGGNYMYLCRKPRNPSLLDWFGPWPFYLAVGAAAGLALFWLLWFPVRLPARTWE